MVKKSLAFTRAWAAVAALVVIAMAAPVRAEVHAELDRSEVGAGEPVRLILRDEGTGPAAVPDLRPLEEDFTVLGTQQSQRLEVVNGRARATREWVVTLLPEREGDLEVPAIAVGDARTEPLPLVVGAAPPPPSRADTPDLFVEAEVDERSPVVQGEVRYTVRVFDGVGMLEGTLSEPESPDLRVTPLGDIRTRETTVNGRRYRVHEREYALSPLRSGEVTVPAVTLEARVPAPRGAPRDRFAGSLFEEMFGEDSFAGLPAGFGSSLFDEFFGGGRAVRVRSEPISLSVQARPADSAGGWFLPARDVELTESFDPEQPTFRVGEVVRRTVTLRALGAASEQLPHFEIPDADGVRLYDEGSRDGTAATDEGTVAVLERTVGLLPTRAGTVTLPPIEVEWFDVAAKETRVARLPARTVEVAPAVGATAEESAPAEASAPAHAPAPATAEDAVAAAAQPDAPGAEETRDEARGRAWPWALAAAAFVLGAGSGLLVVRRRSVPAAAAASPGAPAEAASPRSLADDLRRACRAGDARAAREALSRWARAESGRPRTPIHLAEELGAARLAAAIREVDRAVFAPDAAGWRGDELWEAFRATVRAPARGEPADDGGLRPLYPDLDLPRG